MMLNFKRVAYPMMSRMELAMVFEVPNCPMGKKIVNNEALSGIMAAAAHEPASFRVEF